MRRGHLILILGFVVTAMLGYWLAGTAVPVQTARKADPEAQAGPRRTMITDESTPKFRRGERLPASRRDDAAADVGALQGQRSVVF